MKTKMGRLVTGIITVGLMVCAVAAVNGADFTVHATENARVILTQLYPDPDAVFADYISDGAPDVFTPPSADPVLGTQVKIEANAYYITGIWRWDEASFWVKNDGTLYFPATPHPWFSLQGGTVLYGAFKVQASEDVRIVITEKYPDNNVPIADYISDGILQPFIPPSAENPGWGTTVKIEANANLIDPAYSWHEAWVHVGNDGTLEFQGTPNSDWFSLQGGTVLYIVPVEPPPQFTFTIISSADHIMWTAITGNWGFGEDDAIFRQISLPNGQYPVQGNAYALTGIWEWDNATVIVLDGQISLREDSDQEFIQLTDTVITYAGALRRHGQFVSTVSQAVEELMECIEVGECEDIEETEGEIISTVAKSTFGMPPTSQKPGK